MAATTDRRPRKAREATLAAVGVIALAVMLLSSGCTTPSAGTGPAVSATAMPALSSAAPAVTTHVQTFDPWTAAGTLRPDINVVDRSAGTGCTMGSSFDPGNQYAWRCFLASGGFYDPCFAPPARSGVTQVVCMDAPWSGADVISLARPPPGIPGRWFWLTASNAA
jgi:hypothetical protein